MKTFYLSTHELDTMSEREGTEQSETGNNTARALPTVILMSERTPLTDRKGCNNNVVHRKYSDN